MRYLPLLLMCLALPALAEETTTVREDAAAAARKTKEVVKEGATAIGHGARDATKAIGHATRDAVHTVGEAAKGAWDGLTKDEKAPVKK